MNRALLQAYALSFIGAPYRFGTAPGGGDDPVRGFDCSGLVSELLRASGVVSFGYRENAQGMLTRFATIETFTGPRFGDLAFYGKGVTTISHVGFCLDENTMLEAGGGDASTVTLDVASERNAFVRLRPILYRKDFVCLARPPYNFHGE